MIEFRVFLKQALFHWPLLALLIVLQLLLGRISAVALSESLPDLEVALIREGEGPLAMKYESSLEGILGLDVVKAPSSMSREDIFFENSVQGLVVIPSWFDEYMAEGRDGALLFYPAPGVTDPSVAVEFLSTEALLIRADIIMEEAVAELGADEETAPFGAWAYEDKPILVVEYEGPAIQERPLSTPPAFGVPAIFLLLAFLHAIQIVPGRDSRRLMQRGMQNRKRVCFMSLLSLMAVWVCVVMLYRLWLYFFYGVSIPAGTTLSLIGIALYACTLGGVLSVAGIRSSGTWVFVFWLLFNMTLGGGLWGSGIASPYMIPLLPVSSVVSFAGENTAMGTIAIYVSFAACLAAFFGISGTRQKGTFLVSSTQ